MTGKTHELAEMNIPMYVNEVGHSKDLVHNVDSRDLRDRSVEYYIRIEKPMKQAEQVELLTNYFDHYEDVRERKGYGQRNLKRGVKSDDDFGALLMRNFDSREHAEVEIRDLTQSIHDPGDDTVRRVYDLCEFLEENVRIPLLEKTTRFLEAYDRDKADTSDAPSSLQCIAMLRFNWLGPILSQTLCKIEDYLENAPEGIIQIGYPWRSMLEQCKKWTLSMKWDQLTDFWNFDKDVMGSDGKSIHEAMHREMIEMVCYDVRQKMWSPFDPSIWCPIAQDLVTNICDEIGIVKYVSSEGNTGDTHGNPTLLDRILEHATTAVKQIHDEAEIFRERHTRIEFSSGVSSNATIDAKQLGSLRSKMFQYNTVDPKGVVAALSDLLAYFDCAFLVDDHFMTGNFTVPVAFDKRFLMTKYSGFKVDAPLNSLPRSVEDARRCKAEVNKMWYILWQVIFIVHLFGEQYLVGASGTEEGYSLEKLCRHLDFDFELGSEAVGRGMIGRTIWEKLVKTPEKKKEKNKSSNKPSKEESKKRKTPDDSQATVKNSEKPKKQKMFSSDVSVKAPATTDVSVKAPATTVLGASPATTVLGASPATTDLGASPATTDLGASPEGTINAFGAKKQNAVKVWEGAPDEPLEGGWPEGWIKKIFERAGGLTKGRGDRYWYSPHKKYKFRSMLEVKKYLGILRTLGSSEVDEDIAWRMFKVKTSE